MSGSSLDGLDIVYTELEETRGNWSFEIMASSCIEYNNEWKAKLNSVVHLSAKEYALLHTSYGRYIGELTNDFIEKNDLHHKVQLIASHGHTAFHLPALNTSAQIGDGASIAAITGINTVSDLRNIDVALGGQGAPIVPLGENLLFPGYEYYLNLGGIANLSSKSSQNNFTAFDICPANRVLNLLAQSEGKEFDEYGNMAASGKINMALLTQLNTLDYYHQPFPKSLANDFGTDTIYPTIKTYNLSAEDALRTYSEHIAIQVKYAINHFTYNTSIENKKILITGGGAFNTFLIQRIKSILEPLNIEIVLPDKTMIDFKEALIMALLGVLRWREENTVLHSVTGAVRSSIGGAVWIGQEA